MREVDAMARSVRAAITAAYRANPPELAADASPAMELRIAMRRLGVQWLKRFDVLSDDLAAYFAKSATDRSDRGLAAALRKGGFTVRFKPTRTQNDALQAIIGENIGLIKSIPSEYLAAVQGDVMRAVSLGRDLGTVTTALVKRHGITQRRAAFIAKDQNDKATATMTRVRQEELGLFEALWLHSGGGKHPRPEHEAFSGQKYDVRKGAYLEGKWVWPGTEPGCRCVSRTVVPGFD